MREGEKKRERSSVKKSVLVGDMFCLVTAGGVTSQSEGAVGMSEAGLRGGCHTTGAFPLCLWEKNVLMRCFSHAHTITCTFAYQNSVAGVQGESEGFFYAS